MANVKQLVGCMQCTKDSIVYEDTCVCPQCGAERLVVVEHDVEGTITKPRDLFAEIEALENKVVALQREAYELQEYKDNTVWRLQEDDLLSVMSNEDMPVDEQDRIIDLAHQKFSIDTWYDEVQAFIENVTQEPRNS